MKNYFQYAENMIPLFFAILKFCSTKHLFNRNARAKWTNVDSVQPKRKQNKRGKHEKRTRKERN